MTYLAIFLQFFSKSVNATQHALQSGETFPMSTSSCYSGYGSCYIQKIHRVYKVNGQVGHGRPRKTYVDQTDDVLKYGKVRSTQKLCMYQQNNNCLRSARVCKESSKWRFVISAYPREKGVSDSYVFSQIKMQILDNCHVV